MALFIGTSGWAYREWRPAFYPATLPPDAFLAHYGSVLTACEINATAYRLQGAAVVARWADTVPGGFRFAVKAHRRLTDEGAMAWDGAARAFLGRFLASIAPLGARLGAVLLQYEAERPRDDDALGSVLAALPDGLPVAFEFRHESWIDPEVFDRIAAHGGTVVVAETAGSVLDRLPPGPFAYVRLRAERYGAEARDGWLALLRSEAATRPVFAFARHEGIPAGDPFAGVGLAEWLAASEAAA